MSELPVSQVSVCHTTLKTNLIIYPKWIMVHKANENKIRKLVDVSDNFIAVTMS